MATYADNYRGIDFRKHPEHYRIGRGEQGVLIAEPYKSEILPYWKFKTVADAEESATKIYQLFESYGAEDDFVGMDLSRKFLQMGFTRARRYANHPSGQKYTADKAVQPQADDWKSSEKARAAQVFYEYYKRALAHKQYRNLKSKHQARQSAN